MLGVAPPPRYLVERYKGWRADRYTESHAWYARLAEEGQRPRAMIIACCDSRVEPMTMFAAEPGEIFMLRNVANLVPPYKPDHEHHGTSAAIEYAVGALKIAHLLIIGHARCGGVEACHDVCAGEDGGKLDGTTFIRPWIEILRPAYERVADTETDRAARLRALEQAGVVESLNNLMTFPFVREAVEAKRLLLHGAWFDIGSMSLHAYDPQKDLFAPIG